MGGPGMKPVKRNWRPLERQKLEVVCSTGIACRRRNFLADRIELCRSWHTIALENANGLINRSGKSLQIRLNLFLSSNGPVLFTDGL